MHDPFEESLRDMLNSSSSSRDDDAVLGRVLKTANRQVGAGDLFSLFGRCVQGLMIAVNNGSAHVSPVSRRKATIAGTDVSSAQDKAD
ncbi:MULTISPECIES: CrfX protein [unclassified Pseudomonas]|uniref:CrfX protein n=1 Tax=unclassified Pseudomonas TaxID=196821 RepID=UPI003850E025